MVAKIGFKRLTVRVLDGKTPALGTNLFVVEGETGKGATQTAKISGLSSDPVKTRGSDIVYYTSRKGVGDVKAALALIDVPDKFENVVLGYLEQEGIVLIGDETEAPYCSILMESSTPDNKIFAMGLFKGVFAKNEEEMKTAEEKRDSLPAENYDYSAEASDDPTLKNAYVGKIVGGSETELNKLKKLLKMLPEG